MGAQRESEEEPNYDEDAIPNNEAPHEVSLASFALSRHEMTQGQWQRFTGRNPSSHAAGTRSHRTPRRSDGASTPEYEVDSFGVCFEVPPLRISVTRHSGSPVLPGDDLGPREQP